MTLDQIEELDALIVGSGFGGLYLLYKLRKEGLKVKICEWADGLGGVWRWNHYPGARVDTFIPNYEYSIKELWNDWNWKERFPSWEELREYFDYVNNKLDLSRDIYFNTFVNSAHFDDNTNLWDVKTNNGYRAHAKFFLVANGFASKKYIPKLNGLENFKGQSFHTVDWPEDLDITGKKVGIIGTGATGVQVIQEIGKSAQQTYVFQRSPNYAIPMRQRKLDADSQQKSKDIYPDYFSRRLETFTGTTYDYLTISALEVSEEERDRIYQELWDKGGFHFWSGTFKDIPIDSKANQTAYEFWRKKTLQRINDPKKAEILAPVIPPYPFGTKRVSLEQNYYETFNQSNVDVIDVDKNPIEEIVASGVKTSDGHIYDLDILVFATGFDAFTGGFLQIDIRGKNGLEISEKWSKSTDTYLGMTISGFPNMFFLYGPQSPCAFANGPTLCEIQVDWLVDFFKHIRKNDIQRVDVELSAELSWRQEITELINKTLLPKANSWYNGANVPGKRIEPLIYLGGIPKYIEVLSEVSDNSYKGFNFE